MASGVLDQDILACRAGNVASFRKVMEYYQGHAYRFAFRMLCDGDEANDVVQEAFIRIWKAFAGYDPSRPFMAWMYAIVSNICLDHLRSRRRRSLLFKSLPEDREVMDGAQISPEDRISNDQLATLIKMITKRLSPRQQLVFTLRELEDLPVEEVAQITGMSGETIKANLWHARRAIRKVLAKEYNMGRGQS